MSLASAALRRPVTTVAATLALVLLGAVSLGQMPVSLLPDVALPVLTVRTVYTGAAAEEVSRLVAEPIEKAVGATPGLLEMRSVSRNGECSTTLKFAWGTDMKKTQLQVRERLDAARGSIPDDALRPTLLTSDPGERPIAVLALTGPGDLRAVARTAQNVHARQLEQIKGVASVAVVGSPADEIRVDVDPDKARALGLTPDDIANAIKASNTNAIGGTIRRGQFRFSVRTLTELSDPAEIRDIPVGQASRNIRLSDIATVTPASADPRTVVRLDGHLAVGLVVYKDAGANTVKVTGLLTDALDILRKQFPDVQIRLVAAQAQFVRDALSNLTQEIIAGGVLSILLILLFLRDWRMSLAIGLMVPLSVMVSLTMLQMLDVTINILSLGGLALAVGLLVDNAIVVAEATGRLREEGLGYWESASVAAEEVSAPLIGGTLTTVLVFGPIVFVQGLAAALFRDLSIAVVLTLMASLIMALTLMPVMMVWGHKKPGTIPATRDNASPISNLQPPLPVLRSPSSVVGRLEHWGHELAELYESGMKWSLHNPLKVFAISIAVTIGTVFVAIQLPREILPQVDEGTAVAEMRLPPGTAIEETIRQTDRLEAAARKLGSEGIYARVGYATDEEVLSGSEPGSPGTAVFVIPVPTTMKASVFADKLRAAVPDLAKGSLVIDLAGQSEFGSLIGREGRIVRVEVSAQKLEDAEAAATQVRGALEKVKTLTDVRDAFYGTQHVIEITLRRDRIAERNLSIGAIASTLRGALGGVPASDMRETDRRTPIEVRYSGVSNENLDVALASTVAGVPVGQLVNVKEIRAPIEVVRVNQRPVSVVEAGVEKGGTSRATTDVQNAVSKLTLPGGALWEVTGADTEQQRTSRELGLVLVLSVVLMFLVLAGEFSSFTTPLLILLTVPLAAAGGILACWIMGFSLNAVSLIGIIVMVGMADNEAVVKLDAIRRFRELGHPIEEAILLGGRQRLRAIAMTSLTTITGVLPLVFNWGSGGALYQPLAAGVIGGSVSALLVTFFLLPTAYAAVERHKERKALATREAMA